jgi:plastocyanin
MKRGLAGTIVLLIGLALLTGSPVASAALHEVTASGTSFEPAALTIAVGDTVRWIHVSGSHTVTSGTPCDADGAFNAPLNSLNPTFEHVFTTAGMQPYFCIPHCSLGMTGEVEITAGNAGIADRDFAIAGGLHLQGATPNPFAGPTSVRFTLAAAQHVTLEILDPQGRLVIRLADRRFDAGSHALTWSGRDASDQPAPSGFYYATGSIAAGIASSRLLLLR